MINDRFRFARLFRRIPRLRADANAPAEAGDSTSDSAIPRFRGEKVMPDTSLRRLSAYSLAGLVTLALAAALLLLQPADPALAQDDAKGPKITSGPTIASSPASEDTYRAGETITVAVTFSKPVTITEHPRFRLQIGDTGRWAGYESASTDGATLSFAYVVKAADADPDGVSFKKNSLDLNGGTIKDADGNRARLHHDKVADQAGHRVDGSNSEPQFPADTTTRSVSEIWQPGDYVGDPVTAEDADDDTLTYALTGSDAFIVIAGTGQIFVAAGSDLDYETQAEYTVTLTVSDGKNAKGKADARVDDTIQVTITVTNVDEPGVISLSTDTPQVGSELTFDLTDPDGSVTLQYVLWFSAADASSSSGHWKLIDDWTLQDHQEGDNPTAFTPPDDLVGKYLRVFVAYSDGEGSSKNALGIMANQVLSRANRDPQFPADTTTRSLNENSGPGANVGAPVTATDPDDDTLTYALSGADASSFSIDAATGQITANSSLDYEEKHTYSVTVSADDDDGGSATVDVAITVSDRYEIIDFRQAEVPDTVKYPPDEHVALEYTMSHSGPHDTGSQSQSKPSDASEWNTYSIVYNSYLAEDPNTFGVVRKVDKNRSYDFRMRVTYTDGSASPWSQVTARANRPPAFASATATRSVNENAIAGPGANVGAPVAATDPDNDTLTYALSGADASAFSIDSAGQITANSSLDYEEKHSYSVTVSAEDDWGGSDTVDVAITVIDRHEITNLRQVALRQDELPEGGSITDYVAIEWDVSAGAHASNLQIWSETVRSGTQAPGPRRGFKIEKDTSAIRIVQSAPGGVAYDFRVRLAQKDGFNVSLYSPESTITVRANRPPAFASATTTRWAPEKTGPGANVGAPVTATDPDNDTLKYALSGADASAFSIDSAGQITANSSLDYEEKHSYSVTVSAEDDWGGSDTVDVAITVIDRHEITNLRQVALRQDELPEGGSITDYVAIEWDVSAGAHASNLQIWSETVRSGTQAPGPRRGFKIEKDTSAIRIVQSAPGGVAYDFRVRLAQKDGFNVSLYSPESTITVRANRPPAFASATTTRWAPEKTGPGANVGAPVTATDPDNDTLKYALSGADASAFSIDSAGQITANSSLDYEEKHSYSVTVSAEDDWGGSDTVDVAITVIDRHEITNLRQVALRQDELPEGGSITDYVAIEWDVSAGAHASNLQIWSETVRSGTQAPGPRRGFKIEKDTSAIRIVQSAPGGVAYDFRVRLAQKDGFNVSLYSPESTITVRANRPPAFASATTTRWAPEKTGPGANVGAPVTATDPDNDTLKYALSGADASAFSIDSAGQITANSSLDYEEKHSYSVTVSAEDDWGGSDTVDVAITVIDRHEITNLRQVALRQDELPEGGSITDYVAIEWDVSAGAHASNLQIWSETVRSGTQAPGPRRGFKIEKDTSAIRIVQSAPGGVAYDFRVRLAQKDGFNVSLYSPESTITVRANRPPAFASATTTRWAPEKTGPGANVGAPVTATDPDNDTLKYALSGADASAFSIDSAGQITANSSLDYEEKHSYSVTVSAEDDWGGSDTVDVAITVIDRHEITNLRQVALRQDELPEGGSITDYVAIEWDVSAGAHASNLQIWSETVRSGTQAPGPRRGFKIEKDTSAIRIVQSAPGGVAYDFRVRLAQKDGFNVSLYSPESTITVRANRPPAFASATTTRWAPEKTGPGANVGAPVTATDPDNDTLKYALSGADASAFSIDSAGQITANSSLDRGTRSSYSVTVSAADQWSGSGATEVTIKVGGSDDAIPTVSDLRQVEVLPGIVQAPHSPMNYVALEWTLPEGYDLSIHSMAIQRKGVCETNWSASLGAADYSLAVCKNGNCQSNPYGRTASLDWGSHSLAQAGLDVLALVAVPGPGTYDFRVSMARRDGTIRSDWAQVTTMPPAGATSGGPTPSITGPEGPVTGAFQIRVAFPESVTGLEPGDFVTNIAPYDLHNNEFPGVYGPASSGADHTFYVDPVRNGQLTIRLPVGAAQSGCGEHNLASETFTVQVNESNPTPKIYVYEPGPMVGPFNAYISFPEDVQLTALMGHPNGWREDKSGLDMRHIKVTNGIVTDLSRRVPNGPYSGIRRGSPFFRDYALAITPLGDGPVTIELLPGAAWGKESKSFDWNGVKVYDQRLSEAKQFSIEADLYRAKTTITGPESPLTVVGSFHITVTFSKPVVLPRGWELLDRRVLVVNRIKKGMATEGRGNIVWADAKKEGGGIRSIIYTVNPAVLGELTLDLREGVFQIAGNPTRHHDPAIREEMEKGNFPATFSVEIVRAGTQ